MTKAQPDTPEYRCRVSAIDDKQSLYKVAYHMFLSPEDEDLLASDLREYIKPYSPHAYFYIRETDFAKSDVERTVDLVFWKLRSNQKECYRIAREVEDFLEAWVKVYRLKRGMR